MRNNGLSLTTWPSDMKISVDDGYAPLLELLFVRNLMTADPDEEIPKIHPKPKNSVEGLELESGKWREAWGSQMNWLTHRGGSRPPQFTAPNGFDGFEIESFHAWRDAIRLENVTVLSEAPERLNLRAVVEAWTVGLNTIIVLPFEDHYAKYVSESSIIVSSLTRRTPDLYTSALQEFVVAANRE